MSRLERHLNDRIEAATDPVDAAISQVRLAMLLARRSDFPTAKDLLEAVRANHRVSNSPTVYAYVSLAEAMISGFSRGPHWAFDRLRRARLLAANLHAQDGVRCLVDSWIASFSRATYDEDELRRALLGASRHRNDDHETASRFYLVLADASQEVGLNERARSAYEACRVHAVSLGDDLTISAMLHNRASIHVYNLRIARALRESVNLPASLVDVEAQSAIAYANLVDDSTYGFALDLSSVHVLMLREAWSDAMGALKKTMRSDVLGDWPSPSFVGQADMLLCRSKCGQLEADVRLEVENLWDRYRDRLVPPGALLGIATLRECLSAAEDSSEMIDDGFGEAVESYKVWKRNRILMLEELRAQSEDT